MPSASAPLAPSPTPVMAAEPPCRRILVFDSGVGGLSVLREIRRAEPGADITYVADDAAFPYGAWGEPELVARVVALMARLIDAFRPDMVVIACNTASTLVLPGLRARFALPFVGTVPAIKPAATATRSRLVSVLATPGTVKRDYTRALIDTYASHIGVTLVGSEHLAALAEAHMRGEAIDEARVAAEIRPCFRRAGGQRTDMIVLGCTHYPFLTELFERVAPWPVTWIDPAPAIARRVSSLFAGAGGMAAGDPGDVGLGRVVFTSGRAVPPALAPLLATLGVGEPVRFVAPRDGV